VNGDLFANSNTVYRWNSYFSQLLNVHCVSDVRKIEIHTAEPLVPGPIHLEAEINIVKLKKHKSPGSVQILAELIQARGETLQFGIHKLINSIWSKEELSLLGNHIVPIPKKGDKIDCDNYCVISQSTSYKILLNILLSQISPYIHEITGDYQYGFRCNGSITNQIFCIHQTPEKKWEYNETVYQVFLDFMTAYDSGRREVLYNILIEFGISMK
jgi:hypothetical protein